MRLLKRYLRSELNTLLRNDIRFRVIGRMEELSPRHPGRAERRDRAHQRAARGMLFNIALNYGGRAEIVDAARRAIESGVRPEDLDEQRVRQLPLHGRAAGSRSADPHQRRDAGQQLPAVADCLLRDLRHRHAVAGLPPPPSDRSRARVPEARAAVRRHQRQGVIGAQ